MVNLGHLYVYVGDTAEMSHAMLTYLTVLVGVFRFRCGLLPES